MVTTPMLAAAALLSFQGLEIAAQCIEFGTRICGVALAHQRLIAAQVRAGGADQRCVVYARGASGRHRGARDVPCHG